MPRTTQSRRERRTVAILKAEGFEVARAGRGSAFHFIATSARGDRLVLVAVESIPPVAEARFRRLATRCERRIYRWRRRLRRPDVISV